MQKILWIDTETSGVLPWKHDTLAIGAIYEAEGKVIEELDLRLAPTDWSTIEQRALEVNNMTLADLESFPDPRESIGSFIDFMSKYVDRYNKNDKFIVGGYNVSFDLDFLRSTFKKVDEGYFGSWFAWPTLDVQHLVAIAYLRGLRLPDFKLSTVCQHYDIHIDAHTALGDIRATRQLFYELSYQLKEIQ